MTIDPQIRQTPDDILKPAIIWALMRPPRVVEFKACTSLTNDHALITPLNRGSVQ